MIHPDLVAELLYPSYNALKATTTSHPGPIPTVIRTFPLYSTCSNDLL